MPLPSSMDATWLNGSVSFNAQELRRADAGIFGGDGSALGVRGGIVRHGDTSLDVSVSVADVVTIQPGAVVIPGNSGTGNGCYRAALGAAETGTLAARNATNPRVDLLVYRILDDDVVGTHDAYTGRIELITGVPAALPVTPALPVLAVELARISVPASGGGAATVDKSNRLYASASGAPLVVASFSKLPASAPKWQRAIALDTGVEYQYTGAAWEAYYSADRDTGLRDVTALADASWRSSYPNSRVYTRRIGSLVSVTVAQKDNAAGAAVGVMSAGAGAVWPAGFRPHPIAIVGTRYQAVGVTFNNNTGAAAGSQLLVTPGTFVTDLAIYGLSGGTNGTGSITFLTNDAWPAVLPGIAA